MKRYEVRFRPQTEQDLLAPYEYIAARSGLEVDAGYIHRIEKTCLALEQIPNRGNPRDDLRPGLRTPALERRAIIAYEVTLREVTIISILYGGYELASLADMPDDG